MSEAILLIEDDPDFRGMLREALAQRGYAVTCAASAEEGEQLVTPGRFDLILSDVKLPGKSGVEALPLLREKDPAAVIIMMTAYQTRDMAVQAVRHGAYDFFSKPFSLAEMEVVVRRALERRGLESEVARLRETVARMPSRRVVGRSEVMERVTALAARVAALDTTVLITGESGTGKELMADVLHELSPRASGPLIKVNCAAIPDNLLESELFGHEKGAFTGAVSARAGKFEQAQGGTIMLDEIGEMPMTIQPKLLRVVEQKQVERLGGSKVIDVDVRIVAATNRDLAQCVREKSFREDLYYRLNVAEIRLPPLRERMEDIPLLAEHFLEQVNARHGAHFSSLSGDAVAALMEHDWPGNVREFANIIERAAIVGDCALRGGVLGGDEVRTAFKPDLHLAPMPSETEGVSLSETLRQVEKSLILRALARAGGRQTEAASLLGITPKNLWNKLQKHDIKASEVK